MKFEELSKTIRLLIACGFVGFLISISILIGILIQNQETEILPVDMLTSCYKGCQFATQPIYKITPIKEQEIRIKLYDDCVDLCEDKYE
jgi:hypothetical protein